MAVGTNEGLTMPPVFVPTVGYRLVKDNYSGYGFVGVLVQCNECAALIADPYDQSGRLTHTTWHETVKTS